MPRKPAWDKDQGIASGTSQQSCTLQLPQERPGILQASQEGYLPAGWRAGRDALMQMWYYCNCSMVAQPLDSSVVYSSGVAASVGMRGGGAVGKGGGKGSRHGQRQQGSSGGEVWDAPDFRRSLVQFRQEQNKDSVKKHLKKVADHNHNICGRWTVPLTEHVAFGDYAARVREVMQRCAATTQVVTFSTMTTADAIQHFGRQGGGEKVCALNFANGQGGHVVAGGYKRGAQAQEEDLCRRMPSLYPSLRRAEQAHLYPFGPPSGQARYSDVLWTPGVVLARGAERDGFELLPQEQEVTAALLAAAAPNLKSDQQEQYEEGLVYNAVRNILLTPREQNPEITTLILGAWGCGAFGGNPKAMGTLFATALQEAGLSCLYQEVHFAIPTKNPTDPNTVGFKAALSEAGIDFKEMS